jgi:CHAT domain-containing protein
MPQPVKILFLSANPNDVTELDLGKELREVDESIQLGECRDQLLLLPHFAVRVSDLQETLLRHQPHVLHFSGHGSATQGIALKDEKGNLKLVHPNALASLLSVIKDNVRVVVLNACFSALQADEINKVIDITIGMKTTIRDRSAIAFSSAFYQGLAYGRSVKEAFGLGVMALMLKGIPEATTPVLLSKPGIDPARTYLLKGQKLSLRN